MTSVEEAPAFPYPLDATARLAEASAAVEDTRETIKGWMAARSGLPAFGRFSRHFEVLEAVLGQMLDAVDCSLRDEPVPLGGWAYEWSRTAERRVGKVRATFRWYATKYEQREAQGPEGYGRLLLGADEVVRSCYDTPFAVLQRARPPDPLCYLDESFDPMATPRLRPPPGIPAGDEVVGEFVRELPVPTIALPVTCLDKPWWLAFAAHEVGHHVYFDLDRGLAAATGAALTQALAGQDDEIVRAWVAWGAEAFADMWAVLTMGGVLAPMIGQLSAAAPARLMELAGDDSTYPPPLVRLALFGELAARLGVEPQAPSPGEVTSLLGGPSYASVEPLLQEVQRAHLDVVPKVAEALLGLECAGVAVTALSGFDPAQLGPAGLAETWANDNLYAEQPHLVPLDEAWSARTLVAAAARHVARDRGAPGQAEREARLCELLLATLPTTGPEGDLAEDRPAGEYPADIESIGDHLVVRLFEEVR